MPTGKTFLSWSSGKDAAFSLWQMIRQGHRPQLLITTVNKDYRRVSMHGLDVRLLRDQSRAAGIPLHEIPLPKDVGMEAYNRIMHEHLTALKSQGFTRACFGDIFLEDLKNYRIRQMQKLGMDTCFPVWGRDTREMAREMIRSGIKAVVVTVNARLLDRSFAGRAFDESFLRDLPPEVDPCGENGEFHTFVYDAPFFERPVSFRMGETVYREYAPCDRDDRKQSGLPADNSRQWDTGFWYRDLMPVE